MYLEAIRNFLAGVAFEAIGVVIGISLLICVIQMVRYSGIGRNE